MKLVGARFVSHGFLLACRHHAGSRHVPPQLQLTARCHCA